MSRFLLPIFLSIMVSEVGIYAAKTKHLTIGMVFFVLSAAMWIWMYHKNIKIVWGDTVYFMASLVASSVLGILFFKEHLHPRQWVALGLAMVVILLMQE